MPRSHSSPPAKSIPPAKSVPRALSNAQRVALTFAEREGWCVAVEAAGEIVTLRQGRPGRTLVLSLGDLPPTSTVEIAA
jgi:hypothetical protein